MRMKPFFLVVALICLAPHLGHAEPPMISIRVGLVGSHYPEINVKRDSPILDYLAREVGIPVQMVIREDYSSLAESLASGEIDLMESGMFTFLTAERMGAGKLLVGEVRVSTGRTYKSFFIVKTDSNIHSLTDLADKNLALVNTSSISGYAMPRLMLADVGVDNPDQFFKQIVITGGHDRSIEAVEEGAVDAAAVASLFFEVLPPEVKNKFRVIAESGPFPSGVFVVRNGFDPILKEKILRAFSNYSQKVPSDIRRITDIDAFIDASEVDLTGIREQYNRVISLPTFSSAVPYQRLPTVFFEQTRDAKRRALMFFSISCGMLLIILIITNILARRRISTSVGLAISTAAAAMFILFSGLQYVTLAASIDSFSTKKLDEIQSLTLRLVAAVAGASTESMQKVLTNTQKYEMISAARIFRNGNYITSTDANDVGGSIVDRVRTGTFNLSGKDVVQIFDPIVVGNKKYATLQVGISFRKIHQQVITAALINGAAAIVAVLIGVLSTWIVRRRLAAPISELSRAVGVMREGMDPKIFLKDSELHAVATSISRLGREIEDKEELLELKASEAVRSEKPYAPEVTWEILSKIRKMEKTNEEFHHLRKTQILGDSPSWLRTLRDAAIRARDKDPVVIIGPTGSGKTGIARAIHTLSPRADQPFGEFNCAEFASADPMIVLGKLFGYGIDSGLATVDRKGQRGILEEYDGGTLFFDEVGLLPIQAQQLLLLPFEGRPFNPAAGKGKARTVNIRFIFATNERLEDVVHAGRMRHDLLRRIKARGTVEIAPLAERHEDIEMLASHFLAMRNVAADQTLSFTQEAMRVLTSHSFDKYNVSELKGLVDQAFDNALFEESKTIEPKHLGQHIVSDVPSHGFDEDEQKEISALRMFQFNITRAEKHMGFATGSKTLTNRFRGICYRALERSGWDLEKATAEIAGSHSDDATRERIKKKVTDYLEMVRRHTAAGTTDKLFNNLPQKYHSIVEKLLDAVRTGKLS